MADPNFKMFAALVLSEARSAHQWHSTSGMKPARVPGMPPSVALSILRSAAQCNLDVDDLLTDSPITDGIDR